MPPDARDEQELIRRARHGDERALERLYLAHRQFVVALAQRFTGNRDDALDVLQDSFATLVKQLPDFELTSTLRAWLYPVVKHHALDRKRRRARLVSLEATDPEAELFGESWTPPDGDLARLVAHLPVGQREVVHLRFTLGLKLDEIATALGVPTGTVKSRLHHALGGLRTLLEKKSPS
ncbi:MAG: RNA polymerase sigma factor [Acidobacteriota bacterium]